MWQKAFNLNIVTSFEWNKNNINSKRNSSTHLEASCHLPIIRVKLWSSVFQPFFSFGTITLVNFYFEASLKLIIDKFHKESQEITRRSYIRRHL